PRGCELCSSLPFARGLHFMATWQVMSIAGAATSRLHIRLLEPGDFDSGFLETLNSLREVGLTAEEAAQILEDRPPNIRTYVLLVDGQVAATATLLIEQKFIHRGGVVGHIEDVATRPDMRGQGLARRLIEHIIDEARAARCYKVILDCSAEVEPFYERLGFRQAGKCMRVDL
ncbi:MAG: GNAT family N-acetyltransferase, partial [Gemmataceae bacterium]|nr:GNAT family N-acetyltransferase [Gemmataceae bacterium]